LAEPRRRHDRHIGPDHLIGPHPVQPALRGYWRQPDTFENLCVGQLINAKNKARPGSLCEDIANAFYTTLNTLGFAKNSRRGYGRSEIADAIADQAHQLTLAGFWILLEDVSASTQIPAL